MPLFSSASAAAAAAPAAGVWRLDGAGLAALERWDIGPAIVLVPSEMVLLLAVDLPLSGTRARRAALPFAIEDRIAAPLETVHVALGEALGPTTFVAAVVDRELMTGWVDRLAAEGLPHARIVPDALALPQPAAGSWNVTGDADRIVARTDTGAGFAASAAAFPLLWAAGGSLPCTVFGSAIGVDLPMTTAAGPVDLARLTRPALDLRSGAFAISGHGLPPVLRRAAAVVGAGLLAHTLILAADARALDRQAAQRRVATEALLGATLPGTPLTADLDRLLPRGGGNGRLLPLLARAAAALGPVGGLAWTRLAWSTVDANLTMSVEAGDIGGLQRAQAALSTAGLAPVSGAVTAGQGRADGDLTVRAATS